MGKQIVTRVPWDHVKQGKPHDTRDDIASKSPKSISCPCFDDLGNNVVDYKSCLGGCCYIRVVWMTLKTRAVLDVLTWPHHHQLIPPSRAYPPNRSIDYRIPEAHYQRSRKLITKCKCNYLVWTGWIGNRISQRGKHLFKGVLTNFRNDLHDL